MATESTALARNGMLLLAIDVPVKPPGAKTSGSYQRGYFLGSGADGLDGNAARFIEITRGTLSSGTAGRLIRGGNGDGELAVVLYPTKTYAEGAAAAGFADVAPEDRAMIRRITRLRSNRLRCYRVPLHEATLFDDLPEYRGDGAQQSGSTAGRDGLNAVDDPGGAKRRRFPIGLDLTYLKNIVHIFKSCITRPSRLDYFYLVTKTFTVNLMVRLAFAFHGVEARGLALTRAVVAMVWYTLQDAVMTIYGQTYMKFLGRLTGMLRVGNAHIGDFLFVYVQYCVLEFLNRLIIGPVGENPPAYTWRGMGLILVNNLQGLISGGPLTPAINKMREQGIIGYKAMMNLYQVSSLTFYFGMFASFGHQTIYAVLTGSVMVCAWGAYLALTFFFKDPKFETLSGATESRLAPCAAACYRKAAGLAG